MNSLRFNRLFASLLLLVSLALAKTAPEYFRSGAHLFVEGRYPTAAIEVKEGLAKYPSDLQLQRLLKRIEEAQEQQKNECDKKNPGQDKQDPEDQKDNQDQKDQKEDQKDQQQGNSSNQGNSSAGQSSSVGSSSDSQPQDQDQNQGQSSESQGQPDSLMEGQLDKQQAEELLKNFQESDQQKKRKLQLRGRSAPEKDW